MTELMNKKTNANDPNVAETLGSGFLAAADAMAQIGALIGSGAAGVAAIVQRLRARQETIDALSGLDDSMLKDIGVRRHEIARLADDVIEDSEAGQRSKLAA